jgi:hypothetical protein
MTEDYLSLPIRGVSSSRGARFFARVESEDDALVLY